MHNFCNFVNVLIFMCLSAFFSNTSFTCLFFFFGGEGNYRKAILGGSVSVLVTTILLEFGFG